MYFILMDGLHIKALLYTKIMWSIMAELITLRHISISMLMNGPKIQTAVAAVVAEAPLLHRMKVYQFLFLQKQ